MSFKKNLEPTDVSLTSFEVYKSFSFTERDSGSGVFAVPLTKGTDSTLFDFSTQTYLPQLCFYVKNKKCRLNIEQNQIFR